MALNTAGNRPRPLLMASDSTTSPTMLLVPVDIAGNRIPMMTGQRNLIVLQQQQPPPQQYEVDARSLQQNIGLNRRALAAKLERRPAKLQLVQRGILPAQPAATAAIHERIRWLQHVRMGDAIKRRIEQRPSRHNLVNQHILLTDSTADPLIQEKAERLKKCRLADNLNNKLAHRPGPLELVDKRILHVDNGELQRAIQNGLLQFKPTSSASPITRQQLIIAPAGSAVMEVISTPTYAPLSSATSSSFPIARLNSKSKVVKKKSQHRASTPYDSAAVAAAAAATKGGKAIKFHEYKGPTCKAEDESVRINDNTGDEDESRIAAAAAVAAADSETSYELLLHQQQIFLQWQLELGQQQRKLQIVPIADGSSTDHSPSASSFSSGAGASPPSFQGSPSIVVYTTTDTSSSLPNTTLDPKSHCCNCSVHVQQDDVSDKPLPAATAAVASPPRSKLADWRVSDLKNECKKRQLPVSGPKPQLLERLRPYEDAIIVAAAAATTTTASTNNSCCYRDESISASNHQQAVVDEIGNGGGDGSMMVTSDDTPSSTVVLPPICDVIQDYLQHQSTVPAPQYPVSHNNRIMPSPHSSDSSSSSRVATSGYNSANSPDIDLHQLSFAQTSSSSTTPVPSIATTTSDAISPPIGEPTFSFASLGSGGQFTLTGGQLDQLTMDTVSAERLSSAVVKPPSNKQRTPMLLTMPTPGVHYQQQQPSNPIVTPSLSTTTTTATNNNHRSMLHHSVEPQKQQQPIEQQQQPDVLSATTLSIHEEMLRHQQRKIDELQRELQRAQEQLKHQQQVILAAKKAQANGKPEHESRQSIADAWLSHLDTKHLHKFHIQLFLQHKIQQQQMQHQIGEQQDLLTTHQKLQDDLQMQQAVQDIVRLIRQDARTALLMVQLLRRFQLERSQAQQQQQQQQQQSAGGMMSSAANDHQQLHNGRVGNNASDKCTSSATMSCCSMCGSDLERRSMTTTKSDNNNTSANATVQPIKKPANSDAPKHPNQYSNSSKSGKKKSPNRSDSSSSTKSKSSATMTTCTTPHDMEAIFKTVLEGASNAVSSSSGGNEPINENRLPSCDHLMPLHRIEDETLHHQSTNTIVEPYPATTAATIVLIAPDHHQQQNAIIGTHHHYQYSKNEAFDDLMDVLRGDQDEPCPLAMTAVDYEYPNTYGSQELAHILGQDWLQDGGGTDDDDAAAQLRTAPTPAYHTNESGEVESVTHNIVETTDASGTTDDDDQLSKHDNATPRDDLTNDNASTSIVDSHRLSSTDMLIGDASMDWLDGLLQPDCCYTTSQDDDVYYSSVSGGRLNNNPVLGGVTTQSDHHNMMMCTGASSSIDAFIVSS